MKRIRKLLSFTFLIFSIVSCKTDINILMSDYNSNFKKPTTAIDEIAPKPGESNFFAEDMLFDRYFVYNNGTLNLAAPPNCTEILWTMFDPEEEDNPEVSVTLMTGFSNRTRRYVFYTPHSNLEVGKTYQLKLSIKAANGISYKDTCEVAIIKTYNTTQGSRSITLNPSSSSRTAVARTIIPGTYETSDLQYYLEYKDLMDSSNTIKYKKVDLTNTTANSGELALDIGLSVFDMTLYGLKTTPETNDLIPSYAALKGKAIADLRYTTDVSFVLNPSDTQLLGNLDLSLYSKDWNIADYDGATISAEILDSENNTVTPPAIRESLSSSNFKTTGTIASPNLSVALEPGTYTIKTTVNYKGQNYYWYEKAVIIADISTSAEIGIPLLIDTGNLRLRLYTDGWDTSLYSPIHVSTVIKDINNKDAVIRHQRKILSDLTIADLSSMNADSIDLTLDCGTYNVSVIFNYNNKDYIWTDQFIVHSGLETYRSRGIPDVIKSEEDSS